MASFIATTESPEKGQKYTQILDEEDLCTCIRVP